PVPADVGQLRQMQPMPEIDPRSQTDEFCQHDGHQQLATVRGCKIGAYPGEYRGCVLAGRNADESPEHAPAPQRSDELCHNQRRDDAESHVQATGTTEISVRAGRLTSKVQWPSLPAVSSELVCSTRYCLPGSSLPSVSRLVVVLSVTPGCSTRESAWPS